MLKVGTYTRFFGETAKMKSIQVLSLFSIGLLPTSVCLAAPFDEFDLPDLQKQFPSDPPSAPATVAEPPAGEDNAARQDGTLRPLARPIAWGLIAVAIGCIWLVVKTQ